MEEKKTTAQQDAPNSQVKEATSKKTKQPKAPKPEVEIPPEVSAQGHCLPLTLNPV